MICQHCSSENEPARKFCGECGAALARGCPSCGAPNPANVKFCGECGSALGAAGNAGAGHAALPTAEKPSAERRLVSVLFADLVGFTTVAETRDAEEVRELLSRYFDTCRRLIDLYGGTVEKFIGDAVMAVWGTPIATEDDAERAVRAGLDLVAAVTALGDELGIDGLHARAGVLTGEAAVSIGAEGQGMVAGDMVNTAARIQSVAAPGQVFVGESTRRASEPTIVYESAGTFELKGKDGLHQLWHAMRIVSGARGALKAEGLEAPFVGRDRELRQIKDIFHVCADEQKAHLISVTGIAGIGKSRLVWEFYKYFDGLPQIVYWHRGRCLSYGEGVTYWALADMVRMRCRIAEDEAPASAAAKLREVLVDHIADADELAFVEPRVRHLLGLEEGSRFERDDLFAAWRIFFERLADRYPTVLAFEDMQWADASLMDFIEHLLEWSRNSPLFLITHARPELIERRPTWGAGKRNFVSLYLEPLPEPTMRDLLTGLVPGLPASLRDRILVRAEGVPLYAVETVRMLLDRGHLLREGNVYRPAGDVDTLEVPETLQALIAARLDGLSADERRAIQVGAVLGKTFTKEALDTVLGPAEVDAETLLAGLVRKEVLSIQADPRSPEHGQYGFLQDLVRHVAYQSLSKRDRRTLHLAAAHYLEGGSGDQDELAEVLAAHYISAYSEQPDADDADQVKKRARELLAAAGRRASALGAPTEAQRYLQQAAELADAGEERAPLLELAGENASRAAANDAAIALLTQAIELYEAQGDARGIARAATTMAVAEQNVGRLSESIDRMERAYAGLTGEPDEASAMLVARLALSYFFAGQPDRTFELVERALTIAEELNLVEVLNLGWLTKALVYTVTRPNESRGLYRLTLESALENNLVDLASRATGNLSDLSFQADRYKESLDYLDQSIALARKNGSRSGEWFALSEMTYAHWMLGDWDRALELFGQIPEQMLPTGGTLLSPLNSVIEIRLARGDFDGARSLLALYERLATSADVQEQGVWRCATASIAFHDRRFTDALHESRQLLGLQTMIGVRSQSIKIGFVYAVESAIALGEREQAEQLIRDMEQVPIGFRSPFLEAHLAQFQARLGPADDANARMSSAVAQLRELELPYWLAQCLLRQGEILASDGRDAPAAESFDEGWAILGELGVAADSPAKDEALSA
jgi:class 3 adenylate cyclase/tetratricopeptide (TPR) repeat protein